MRNKVLNALKVGVFGVGALLFVGLGIRTSGSMPGYAAVYLDDVERTYIGLPCIEEWHRRPDTAMAVVRLSTAAEAWSLRYEPDYECRETGAFVGSDSSLTRGLLVKLGLLSPPQQWWDAPYRNEAGEVTWPKP